MGMLISGTIILEEAQSTKEVNFIAPTQSAYTPQATNDPYGNVGLVVYDTSYMYVKTDVGWKRAVLQMF